MIIEELLTLPPWVDFEGINFEFQLFNDGGTEMRMCYVIAHVDNDSPHKAQYDDSSTWDNKFANHADPPAQGWLKLYEGITDDASLLWAIRDCWYWLQERGLLGKDKPYG